jgi:hypothetical protein
VIPLDQYLQRLLMPSGGLKEIREAVEKRIKEDETKPDADKDNPTK